MEGDGEKTDPENNEESPVKRFSSFISFKNDKRKSLNSSGGK